MHITVWVLALPYYALSDPDALAGEAGLLQIFLCNFRHPSSTPCLTPRLSASSHLCNLKSLIDDVRAASIDRYQSATRSQIMFHGREQPLLTVLYRCLLLP